MNELKYAVYPGWVASKNDGQEHYVKAENLMMLYRVPPEQCLVVYPEFFKDRAAKGILEKAKTLIPLRPSYHGNYTLPCPTESTSQPVVVQTTS